ncbi:hypothetical protein RND71_035518 [Anisodus tanguticus]|uniref:Uncharacterized protein n=1 Tax=Anisodus tanguticus TaxID=243964 RepID=A0AAE1R770_9SOLA|nr:hypothetical protein RND71_035518 [Anisodus tanguticus]
MPSIHVAILEPRFSNHSPLKVVLSAQASKPRRPFRLLKCLADHDMFSRPYGSLKKKKLNTTHFQGVDGRVKDIRHQLQVVQESMKKQIPTAAMIEEEKALRVQLEKWGKIEESIYKQKSRIR